MTFSSRCVLSGPMKCGRPAVTGRQAVLPREDPEPSSETVMTLARARSEVNLGRPVLVLPNQLHRQNAQSPPDGRNTGSWQSTRRGTDADAHLEWHPDHRDGDATAV